MPIKFIIILASVLCICSCQQAHVNVNYNKDVDFFKYKTYDWLSAAQQSNKQYTSLKEQQVRKVVLNVLSEKSLHRKAEKPDVLVAVHFVEKEKVHYSPRFSHHYDCHWGFHSTWRHYEPDYFLETTLVIAFVDPKSKESLWEASVEDWSYTGASSEVIEKMIRALLENYPPTDTEAYVPVP